MSDQHRLNFLEEQNDHLKTLMFEHLTEIADIRREVKNLKQTISDRQIGNQEKRLILMAKSIIQNLDPDGNV
ncbi:hypothetical protein [Bacillus sp. FJAT-28004]|uniref:hypothetical protein n=1 Tax=Bacillus sp. FJAT-28004 TaxID=1679165 RepID=UPI0006B447D1|nr:hypothetical protein [Bacillus sp. FJAT-28004]